MIEFISEVRVINREESRTVTFTLGDMIFEYDERKNEYNIVHHGISFKQAARVLRVQIDGDEEKTDVTRLISARFATNFERGLYYGKY